MPRILARKMKKTFVKGLSESDSLSEIFELVKIAVHESKGVRRPGLMLGLVDMGTSNEGFIGAFHPVGSNFILMNQTPLKKVSQKNPKLYKPYVFHILLHEYLHSLGMRDEDVTRKAVRDISKKLFGNKNVVTQMAKNFNKFFPDFAYPTSKLELGDLKITIVSDFESSSAPYLR